MGTLSRLAVLLRTSFTALVSVSLFSAVANAAALALVDGRGRLRETTSYFTVRHLAEFAGVNMLAASPMVVHREFDLHDPLLLLRFAGATAVINLILLGAAAIACGVPLALAGIALRRRDSLRARFDPWMLPILAAVLLSPLLAVAANGLLHLPELGIPFRLGRRATLGIGSLFVLMSAVGLRLVARRDHLPRILAAISAILAIPLAAGLALPNCQPARADRPAPPAGAPNILLISIDTLRADHLHCYGYPRATSPRLDRLAGEGALFREAFAPTSWTLPSHLTLLTSLPPEQHGVIIDGRKLAAGIPTLAEVLRNRGYETAGFVSGAYLDGRFGFAKSFDEYDDYTLVRLPDATASRLVSSPTVARLANDYLARWNRTRSRRPFFLFLHFYDPHQEYVPPPPYDRMFDRTVSSAEKQESRELREMIALYDGEIAWTDHHIGLVLDGFQHLGILDQTLVIVTSDHGEEFFEHGEHGHRASLYDEVLRVPLLMRYPKRIPPGSRIDRQVRLMDVMPTVLSLAGLTRKEQERGARDLSPLFDAGSASSFPTLLAFGDLEGRISSVRTRESKYIKHRNGDREELYDLIHDPHERANQISESRSAAPLREHLARWKAFCAGRESAVERHELDEEQKRSLRSLGYIQ